MMIAMYWQAKPERSHLASVLLIMLLVMKIPGGDMLEIFYPTKFLQLQEGDSLILNCTVKYRWGQSHGLDAHWCKQIAELSDCAKMSTKLERVASKETSDSEGVDSFTILLQITQVKLSDSGNYQCQAKTKDPVLSAMGHYIRVNVSDTQTSANISSESYNTQRNKALRINFHMLKAWIMIQVLMAITLPSYGCFTITLYAY